MKRGVIMLKAQHAGEPVRLRVLPFGNGQADVLVYVQGRRGVFTRFRVSVPEFLGAMLTDGDRAAIRAELKDASSKLEIARELATAIGVTE